MINSVSHFLPSVIGSASFPVARGANVGQPVTSFTSAVSTPPALPSNSTRPFFGDSLQHFFSLSPSDFSSVFSDSGDAPSFTGLLSQLVSAAYTQSTLLTASRLSIQV